MLKQNLARLTTGAALAALLVSPHWRARSRGITSIPFPRGRRFRCERRNRSTRRPWTDAFTRASSKTMSATRRGSSRFRAARRRSSSCAATPDNDLVLDLDSVTVNGRRYGVDATRNRIGGGIDIRNSGIGANKETARNVGGGAVLGAILGAVIGGGDGAAAGAAAGAAVGAGAQILTKGRRVNVPAEALLSYRLQSDMYLDVQDSGYDRDGRHYHSVRSELAARSAIRTGIGIRARSLSLIPNP